MNPKPDKSVFCVSCGAESFVGAHFCMRCGGQLPAEAAGPGTLRHPAPAAVSAPVPPVQPATTGMELADLERTFNALVAEASEPAGASKEQTDPRHAFRLLAQEHLRPIRDFMIELSIGDADYAAIPACSAAIERLVQPARALGLEQGLITALEEMASAFTRLKAAPERRIPFERAVLKRAYAALIKVLPAGISHESEPLAGEPVASGEPSQRAPDPNPEGDSGPASGQNATAPEHPSSGGPSTQEGESEHKMDNGSTPKEKRTVIEEGSHFKGSLASSCPVDVRGRIDGEIETPTLTVSATGAVHGAARVGSVRSEGELAGEFDADTVELSGVVKDNTVIRARSMQVKLSSERGKLQVIFGEIAVPATDARPAGDAEPLNTPPAAGEPASATAIEMTETAQSEPPADPEARTEPGFSSDETGTGRRGRRNRGTRHSEPPPGMG